MSAGPFNHDMIARLESVPEFAELVAYWKQEREEAVKTLARKSFAQPAEHDVIEWERLRAYYAGVDAVLGLPKKFRKPKENE